MIGGSERLLEVRRTVLADLQKTIGKAKALFTADALQPLTKGNRDGGRHAISSQLCQLLRQAVRFLIFDVKAHPYSTFLPYYSFHSTSALTCLRRRMAVAPACRGRVPSLSRSGHGLKAHWVPRDQQLSANQDENAPGG